MSEPTDEELWKVSQDAWAAAENADDSDPADAANRAVYNKGKSDGAARLAHLETLRDAWARYCRKDLSLEELEGAVAELVEPMAGECAHCGGAGTWNNGMRLCGVCGGIGKLEADKAVRE